MDSKIVFAVTLRGAGEIKSHTSLLSGDIKRALALVDDRSTVAELTKRAAPSLRDALESMLQKLLDGGFIEDKARKGQATAPRIATPKIAVPGKKIEDEGEELDFTSFTAAPGGPSAADEAAKLKAQAEARAQQEAEAARAKAQQEAATAKAKAEAEARVLVEAKAWAEARAKQEMEAARLKAQQEAAAAKAQLEAAQAKAALEAQARLEAEARAKQEVEAARLKAQQEAAAAKAQLEAAQAKAALEAQARVAAEARAAQEAEATRRKLEEEAARVRAEAEAARLKVEQEAARAKAEMEAARLKAEEEARAQAMREVEAVKRKAEEEAVRAEAARKQQAEQETARMKAEEEASAQALRDAEVTKRKAEEEAARVKAEEEAKVQARLQAEAEIARVEGEAKAAKTKVEAVTSRSMIATVLFFDVVGYTKQSVSKQIELKDQFNGLVSEFIKDIEENLRIILDTGDGAAIGFLQHPEHAIEVALQFRNAVTANKHQNYPELKVRMGIHLGPVNVVKDMNGQGNMVGDGINDAQRIMSFAAADQIFISRAYYDVASRLSSDYAKLFQYHGVESDKHGRQHQVYEVKDEKAGEQPQISQGQETSYTLQLDAFSLGVPAAPEKEKSAAAQNKNTWEPESTVPTMPRAADLTIAPTGETLNATAEALEKARQAKLLKQQEAEAVAVAARFKAEQEAARLKAAEVERKMAEEQSKMWAIAEQRAKAQAAATQAVAEAEAVPATKVKPGRPSRPRKPLPLGKIAGALVVLLLLLAFVLPMVWPMQEYVAQVEKKVAAQLQQPVHIGSMKVALLPLPKLELQDVSIGGAQELKLGNVVLDFSIGALFSDTRSIRQMNLSDVAVQAESLAQVLSWLQIAGSDMHYPLAHLAFQRLRVNGENLNLPPLQGTADWDGNRLGKAAIRSEDGKLDAELQAEQAGWQVKLRMKDSSLPMLPGVLFNEFNAKGMLEATGANLSELDGSLYGGLFTGNARVSWQKGWQVQGNMNLKLLELETAFPQYGITGEVEGNTGFLLSAPTFAQLGSAPRLDGNFVVRKGTLNKLDIVEIAGAARQGAGGARTHFGELSGAVQLDNNTLHFRQLKLSAGVMNATGAFDVGPARDLSGRLAVDLKMRAGQGSVPLQLSGTLTQPVLRAGR